MRNYIDDKYNSYRGSSHTINFINPRRLKRYIVLAVKYLKQYHGQYDTIAFAGISGAVIGPVVAMKLKKECILVRKNGDIRQSFAEVTGYDECRKYIIIDDFICSGHTVKMIQNKIHDFLPDAECLGVLEVQSLKGAGSYGPNTELTKDNILTFST
jgi:adenine/guanine phosphoribosyltransferase-like PRPP-binding protein